MNTTAAIQEKVPSTFRQAKPARVVPLLPLRPGDSSGSIPDRVEVACRLQEKYFGLFDTFFEAVIPSPARPGLSGVPTPRSHL